MLSARPTVDQAQVDRAVEDAAARVRAETRAELSVEFARSLESQRREFASQLEAFKERVDDALTRAPAPAIDVNDHQLKLVASGYG